MNTSNQKENDSKGLIRHSIVGAVLGMLMTLLILFGISILMMTGTLSGAMCDSFIIVSVLLGTTISGVYCAGKQGRGVITAGLLSAVAYIILLLLGTLMFMKNGNNVESASITLKEIIAAVAGGCFGGVLRLYKKGKKSRLRK